MTKKLLATGMAAAALLASAAAAQSPRVLSFCAGTDNFPLSDTDPERGIEVEFARALAGELGAEARIEWVEPHENPGEAALEGRCDAALGAVLDPGPMAEGHTPPGLVLTRPYYDAGYLLIHGKGAPPVRALEEVGDTRIAVEMVSIPVYTLRQRGRRVHVLHDYGAVVDAVAAGRAEYGYVWGPLAAWLVRDRVDVRLAEGFEPVDRWSFALAVREGDAALLGSLNTAIGELVRRGEVARIFSRHGVPYLRPRAEEPTRAGR